MLRSRTSGRSSYLPWHDLADIKKKRQEAAQPHKYRSIQVVQRHKRTNCNMGAANIATVSRCTLRSHLRTLGGGIGRTDKLLCIELLVLAQDVPLKIRGGSIRVSKKYARFFFSCSNKEETKSTVTSFRHYCCKEQESRTSTKKKRPPAQLGAIAKLPHDFDSKKTGKKKKCL